MLSAKIDKRLDSFLAAVADAILRRHIHPHLLTLSGLIINCGAGVAFAFGYWRSAAIIMLTAGAFDMLDGAVARESNLASPFGEFLDSVVDRYSDTILLTSIAIFYTRQADVGHVILVGGVLIGTVLVPYVRAKAERFLPKCDVGLMERAERILVLAAGALFGLMTWALIVLLVLTHITVLQRIHHTWASFRPAVPSDEPAEEIPEARTEAKILPLRRQRRP